MSEQTHRVVMVATIPDSSVAMLKDTTTNVETTSIERQLARETCASGRE